jgi:isopentenyl diphosphate isomerase/L-lactate dehydrogenase-like FMN-dependent dehydrogenase
MNWRDRAISAPRVVNIADLRRLAQKRLPKVIFEYVDGGAEGEVTLRDNCRAFESVGFRPRHAVPVPQCNLHTTVLGSELAMPMLLAPCGFSRIVHPDGEVAAARAAGKAGIGHVLSTVSGHPMEDVAGASSGPFWYQLYLVGGRGAAENALERAQRAGFQALVITIDTNAAGMRERDIRNGTSALMAGTILARIPFLPQLLTHPGWLASFVADGAPLSFPNVVVPGRGPLPMIDAHAALRASAFTWEDMSWVREFWPGPIVIKGVLTGDDAKRSLDEGAVGVIVSNHGGRQLDGVPATLRALPEVLKAVNGRAEVLMDGGIRRGSDIVKAICLGARAVLIGRAYMYGLGAAGEAGIDRVIAILRDDIERCLILLGCSSITALDQSYLELPAGWPAKTC